MLRRNAGLVHVYGVAANILGQALIGSILFAPYGLALIGSAVTLSALANDCDLSGTARAEAAKARDGATVGAVLCGLLTVLATFSVVGIPAAPVLGTASGVFSAAAVLFGAIARGRAPTAAEATGLFGALSAMNGGSGLEVLKEWSPEIGGLLSRPEVRDELSRRLKSRVPSVARAAPAPVRTRPTSPRPPRPAPAVRPSQPAARQGSALAFAGGAALLAALLG